MGMITNDFIGSIAAAYKMKCCDLRIQELLLKQKYYKAKKMPVSKEQLGERMEVINLSKGYIQLRRTYPFASKHIEIGSDEVLVQITKCMIYEALEKDIAKAPILIIKEETNGSATEKR
jgi:hypothetical protein